MTTEILSIIIVIGAAMVWLARRALVKTKESEQISSLNLEKDTNQLKKELTQSADEIIDRIAIHVDHLESLLKEADRKSAILKQQIDYLEALRLDASSKGIMQQNIVQNKANESADFDAVLNESINRQEHLDSGKNVAAQESVRNGEYANYASEMTKESSSEAYSIELSEDEVEAYIKSRSVDEIPEPQVESLVDKEFDSEANSELANKLIDEGYPLEEVARKTNLGIGAVSLIYAMKQRQD